MASFFSSCFGGRQSNKDASSLPTPSSSSSTPPAPAGYRPVDNVNPAKCIFCNIYPEKFNVVLEDDKYICFSDRSPAAATHLLVIPRTHIANVQSLTYKDSGLVKEMQALGDKALDVVAASRPARDGKAAGGERRFGFHIPPFRSVDHLHLHCLELPFRSTLKGLKYRVAKPSSSEYIKGWSWFAEWTQTCALLDAGKKVKVSSC